MKGVVFRLKVGRGIAVLPEACRRHAEQRSVARFCVEPARGGGGGSRQGGRGGFRPEGVEEGEMQRDRKAYLSFDKTTTHLRVAPGEDARYLSVFLSLYIPPHFARSLSFSLPSFSLCVSLSLSLSLCSLALSLARVQHSTGGVHHHHARAKTQ